MPNYSYRCNRCGHTRDVVRPMADSAAITICDHCEKGPMDKLFSASFHYAYGREQFHGPTIGERQEEQFRVARAAGIEPEPAGARWV